MKINKTSFLKSFVAALVALLAVICIYRWFALRKIESSFNDKTLQQNEIASLVQREYGKLTGEQFEKLNELMQIKELWNDDEKNFQSRFAILAQHNTRREYTIDIVDTNGTLIAWNGDNVRELYSSNLFTQDTSVSFVERGNRVYFSLGIHVPSSKYFLFFYSCVSAERRFPREKNTFQSRLNLALRQPVHILLKKENASSDEDIIPLYGKGNDPIGYVAVKKITKETFYDLKKASIEHWCKSIAGLAALLLMCLLWIVSGKLKSRWYVVGTRIFIVWALRIFWIMIEFPAKVLKSEVFQPALYSSSFGWGMASSLGDAILSIGALAISVALIGRELRQKFSASSKPLSINIFGASFSILILAVVQILLLRAFGACVHSFVFGSTIDYYNSSNFFPSNSVFLASFAMLLLASVTVYCSFFIFNGMFLFARNVTHSTARQIVVIILAGTIGIFIVSLFDVHPQAQRWIWFLLLFLFCLSEWICFKKQWRLFDSVKHLAVLLVAISAFVLTIPVFLYHSEEKERQYLESLAKEYARPTDVWLTFLMEEGAHSMNDVCRRQPEKIFSSSQSLPAYRLWLRTEASKYDNSSAVFLYDTSGTEFDRFVVGLNSFEEREVLNALFQGEEEVVHTVSISGMQDAVNYYGIWITVRDSSENVVGTIAFIVSSSSPVSNGITSQLSKIPQSLLFLRDIGIAEYKSGKLASVKGTLTNVEPFVPKSINEILESDSVSGQWYRSKVDGKNVSTFFVKDRATSDRILALAVSPIHNGVLIFQLLKFSLSFGVVAVLIFLSALLHNPKKKIILSGFRARMLLGFIIIALAPLILLGAYSRKMANETSSYLITTVLNRDLETLDRRFRTYIEDEDDFINGVDDDFCKAVASEYGIDFTVYRNSVVHASSMPELYRSGLQSNRLDGLVYAKTKYVPANIIVGNGTNTLVKSIVGYKPFIINGNIAGIISISTYKQYMLLDIDVVRNNATLLSSYILISIIVVLLASIVTVRITKPLGVLSDATRKVGDGDLSVRVNMRTGNEFDDLITSFNAMVDELQRRREESERLERERAWREMAKQVAHEIRNPLTPMKLSIQHLQQVFKDQSPDRERLLQEITKTLIEQIESLSHIASEFSMFAKMPEQRFERVNIGEILRQTVQVFSSIQNIHFEITIPEITRDSIADREQLSRAFLNIIKNAVQAMNNGGTISIVVTEEERLSIIKIHDNGPGISQENLKKIFEPNFSTKSEGMGLGLAIARRIIEESGGTVTCESIPGSGTTFTICLPS